MAYQGQSGDRVDPANGKQINSIVYELFYGTSSENGNSTEPTKLLFAFISLTARVRYDLTEMRQQYDSNSNQENDKMWSAEEWERDRI